MSGDLASTKRMTCSRSGRLSDSLDGILSSLTGTVRQPRSVIGPPAMILEAMARALSAWARSRGRSSEPTASMESGFTPQPGPKSLRACSRKKAWGNWQVRPAPSPLEPQTPPRCSMATKASKDLAITSWEGFPSRAATPPIPQASRPTKSVYRRFRPRMMSRPSCMVGCKPLNGVRRENVNENSTQPGWMIP